MTLYNTEPEQAEGYCIQDFERRLKYVPPFALADLLPGELNLNRFVWCDQCFRVWRLGSLYLDGGTIFCAQCGGFSTNMYWWDGWLRYAVPNWKPEPQEGSYWFDTHCLHTELLQKNIGDRSVPYENNDEWSKDVCDKLGDFSEDGAEPAPPSGVGVPPLGSEYNGGKPQWEGHPLRMRPISDSGSEHGPNPEPMNSLTDAEADKDGL